MAKTQFSHRLSYKVVLSTLLALGVFFLLLTSVIGLGQKYFTLRTRTKELKEEQQALIAKEQALTEQNAYLETIEGQAQLLRSKFNVVQPGEEIIVISNTLEDGEREEDVEVQIQEKKSGFWHKILRAVGLTDK